MKNQFMKNGLFALITLLAFSVVGCASPPQELLDARKTYEEVKEGPASELAPAELAKAEEALEQAEESFDENGDEPVTRSLAYRAMRKAQIAAVEAEIYQATRAKEENQELYMKRSEMARKSLQDQLAQQQREIEDRRAAIEQQREEIQEMQASLEEAKEKGQMTAAELKEQQQKLQEKQQSLSEKEQKLAVLRTELKSERERRKEMEERLEKAMAKLDEFAKVDETKERTVITLTGEVLFDVGESNLRNAAKRRLDSVVEVLLAQKDREITVEGHTDNQGDEKMNEKLSQDRADSVKDYFVDQGVAADRIEAKGMGESQPVAPNDTPEGRANNRRVEIIIENPPGGQAQR